MSITKKAKLSKQKLKAVAAQKPLVFLDLGCGDNKINREGLHIHGLINLTEGQLLSQVSVKIIGVDQHSTGSVDKIWDMTKAPYPFEKNSVDGAFSSHFLEHLTGDQRIVFFNEMYRILKPGAKMRLIHPYYKSERAVQDPTHKFPPIAEPSYLYWNKGWREMNKLGHYLGNCDFDFWISYTFIADDPLNPGQSTWMQKSEEVRNFAIKHYFNVVADMQVDLQKKV